MQSGDSKIMIQCLQGLKTLNTHWNTFFLLYVLINQEDVKPSHENEASTAIHNKKTLLIVQIWNM